MAKLEIDEFDLQDWADELCGRPEVIGMPEPEQTAFKFGVSSLRAEIIRRSNDS